MEKLEIATDMDGADLRCKGWCHDFSPGTVGYKSTPAIEYFE